MFLGPILVDQLFHLVTSKFSQDQWSHMFKTSQDLTTFLKMFSDAFHVQANLVTLIQRPKVDLKLFTEPKPSNQTKSFQQHQYTEVPTSQPEPIIEPPQYNHQSTIPQPKPSSISFRLGRYNNQTNFENRSSPPIENESNNNNLSSTSNSPDNISLTDTNSSLPPQPTLRAAATNFVADRNRLNQSVNNSANSSAHNSPSHQTTPMQNQTLKQRINSLVMKTLAENNCRDHRTVLNTNSTAPVNSGYFNAGNNGDTWKMKIFQSTQVLANVKECSQIIDNIFQQAKNMVSWL